MAMAAAAAVIRPAVLVPACVPIPANVLDPNGISPWTEVALFSLTLIWPFFRPSACFRIGV